jgi:hypothetical protein
MESGKKKEIEVTGQEGATSLKDNHLHLQVRYGSEPMRMDEVQPVSSGVKKDFIIFSGMSCW